LEKVNGLIIKGLFRKRREKPSEFLIRVPPVRVGPGAPIISNSYDVSVEKSKVVFEDLSPTCPPTNSNTEVQSFSKDKIPLRPAKGDIK
jgi:hypothetical protein